MADCVFHDNLNNNSLKRVLTRARHTLAVTAAVCLSAHVVVTAGPHPVALRWRIRRVTTVTQFGKRDVRTVLLTWPHTSQFQHVSQHPRVSVPIRARLRLTSQVSHLRRRRWDPQPVPTCCGPGASGRVSRPRRSRASLRGR